jgi:hypothetical protein
MVSFAATNQQSELAFQEFTKSKMKAEKEKTATERHHYLMFLIKKNYSGEISSEEIELFKNM